jgi:hypothetical protein
LRPDSLQIHYSGVCRFPWQYSIDGANLLSALELRMILNEGLDWSQVGAIVEGKDPIRKAFREMYAERVLLNVGFELYKFNDVPFLTNKEGKLSSWWQPYRPFKHDPGYLQKVKTANFLGRADPDFSIMEYARVTSAIKENWNSLEYLLVIALSKPMYAWFGGYASMERLEEGEKSKRNFSSKDEKRGGGGQAWADASKTKRDPARLPGGGTQFYIPNIEPQHISVWRIEDLRKSARPKL